MEDSLSFQVCGGGGYPLYPSSPQPTLWVLEAREEFIISSLNASSVYGQTTGRISAARSFVTDDRSFAQTRIHSTACLGSNVVLGRGVCVDARAVVDNGAVLEDGVRIGAGSFIGRGCHIGQNSEIRPGAAIYEGTLIGRNVLIDSAVVIGSDGFGYAPTSQGHYKVPQVGIVIIKDGVHIGSGSCIDRATLGKTILNEGVVVGRQVQIGHNVVIGEGSVIGDQCGVCGSVRIGRNVHLGRRVGVAGHISIADDCVAEDFSGVSKSIPEASHVSGYPAAPVDEVDQRQNLLRELPRLHRQISEMERRVESR